jgi:S-methylmethionine-dependent homocysteine/selenocysteine methylase
METEIIILDGGIGHELKLRGVSDGTFVAGVLANENCSTDSVVEAIHRDYLTAGCVVITTNSFVAVSVFGEGTSFMIFSMCFSITITFRKFSDSSEDD